MKSKLETVQEKIIDQESLIRHIAAWRIRNDKIVFTNGCFDILHKGHIELIIKAAQEGNRLIIGLNTDDSVKRLKGSERPINKEADRALLLAAQLYVDAVILFDEDTPIELIKLIKPDVLVKGGDYTIDTIVGADIVRQNGGEVIAIPLTEGYATTEVINRLKNNV